MGDPSQALSFGSGTLILDPTDLSDPDNDYGGTVLGTVHAFAVVPNAVNVLLTAEEWGGEPTEAIHLRYALAVACVFNRFDQNAVAALYLNATTNVDTVPTLSFPATEGELVGDSGMKLLYAADEADEPSALIYDALPDQPAAELKFSSREPRKLVATMIARRDDYDRTCVIDLISRLTLGAP